jgi:hypothetical protein
VASALSPEIEKVATLPREARLSKLSFVGGTACMVPVTITQNKIKAESKRRVMALRVVGSS